MLTCRSISQTENHGFIPRDLKVRYAFFKFCVVFFFNNVLNKIKTHSE